MSNIRGIGSVAAKKKDDKLLEQAGTTSGTVCHAHARWKIDSRGVFRLLSSSHAFTLPFDTRPHGPSDLPSAQAVHKGEELMRHLQEKSGSDEQQSASSAASDAKITLFKNGFLLGAEDAGGEFYDLSVPKNQAMVDEMLAGDMPHELQARGRGGRHSFRNSHHCTESDAPGTTRNL
jgi:hypothetical protein